MKLTRSRILMYHSVSVQKTDRHLVCTSPHLFARQMAALAKLGLRGVSMRDFLASDDRSRLAALTFDDGYTDFLYEAVPVLESHGFTATVFALCGDMRENVWDWGTSEVRLRLMSAPELRECERRGMEVASHGISHAHLSTLDPETLRREISESRIQLAGMTGAPVTGFCYPYGDLTREAVRLVAQSGYDYACSVDSGSEDGRFAIPRIPVNDLDVLPRFVFKLGAYWSYTGAKSRAGRIGRKLRNGQG